jgi:hypothetical protein
VCVKYHVIESPVRNPISPIRLYRIAFRAALQANNLSDQKLINKNEHIPTPSHPSKNNNKFEAVVKIIIKRVNRDKYARNFVCL